METITLNNGVDADQTARTVSSRDGAIRAAAHA
jgi:hypothetical protein